VDYVAPRSGKIVHLEIGAGGETVKRRLKPTLRHTAFRTKKKKEKLLNIFMDLQRFLQALY